MAIIGIVGILFYLAVIAFFIAVGWRLYTKAGQPGWASIVPIYNAYVMLKMVGRPGWWLLLYFIPLVNIIIAIIVTVDLAKVFGQGVGFALLMLFLPFIGYPVLAFGDAVYTAPGADVTEPVTA